MIRLINSVFLHADFNSEAPCTSSARTYDETDDSRELRWPSHLKTDDRVSNIIPQIYHRPDANELHCEGSAVLRVELKANR